jgi:hypothetical protein
MAGEMTYPTLTARATADLLPGFCAFGGRSRNVGPDLCPTGH